MHQLDIHRSKFQGSAPPSAAFKFLEALDSSKCDNTPPVGDAIQSRQQTHWPSSHNMPLRFGVEF